MLLEVSRPVMARLPIHSPQGVGHRVAAPSICDAAMVDQRLSGAHEVQEADGPFSASMADMF